MVLNSEDKLKARIVERKNYSSHNGRIIVYKMELPYPFYFKPGQYVEISSEKFRHRRNPEKLKWSAFSVASSPLQIFLEICMKIVGTRGLTYFLAENKDAGNVVNVRGPFGRSTLDENFKEICFIGLGTGIAWPMSMLRTLIIKQDKRSMSLFYGFRDHGLFVFKEELEFYARELKNFSFYSTVNEASASWKGNVGFVQDLIAKHKFKYPKEKVDVYICGPPKALIAVKDFLIKEGFRDDKIHRELW